MMVAIILPLPEPLWGFYIGIMMEMQEPLLMKVFNDPELNEFQYIVEGDNWIINLK